VAASAEDYLIPSSILNATLSGLISRSVLNADYIYAQDFHGCVFYQQPIPNNRNGIMTDLTLKILT
jgi:hypothetical protein